MITWGDEELREYRVAFLPGYNGRNGICPSVPHQHMYMEWDKGDAGDGGPTSYLAIVEQADGSWLVEAGGVRPDEKEDLNTALKRLADLAANTPNIRIRKTEQPLLPDDWEPGGYL